MHTGSGALGTRLDARDSTGSGDKLSTGSIVAIAVVCACVGLLLFSLFLWRLIIRCCRPSKPAPLPPVQELAHRREQQVAAYQQQAVSRPTTWLDGSVNSRRSRALYETGSAASLLPGPNGPQRKSSLHTDEAATAESSSSTTSPPLDPALLPPNPAFFGTPSSSPHNSFVSLGAASTSSLTPSPSPVPFSETSSTGSHTPPLRPSSSHSSQARPSRSRSNFRRDSQSRRLSVVSSTGTTYSSHTMRNGNIIHGAPHGPHSSIQIVLPAPLASHSLNSEDTLSDRQSVRTSMFADQWVAATSRHASVDGGDRGRGRGRHSDRCHSSQPARRYTADSTARRSPSPDLPPLPTDMRQRSASQPRPQTRPHVYIPPPVPRIPEVRDYPGAEASSASGRGRPIQQRPTVDTAVPSDPASVPLPMSASSPTSVPPHKPGVLHKPRPPAQ